MSPRTVPPEHSAFVFLPVQHVPLASDQHIAVHLTAPLRHSDVPLVCLAGYTRNMSDFSDFVRFASRSNPAAPIVLMDLRGRGRSSDRPKGDYFSQGDADDVASVLAALGVSRSLFLGQGHGGQVLMTLAARHPRLVAGTILLDSGPVSDSRGIVRLRNNLKHIENLRGAKAVTAGFRRMLGGDYPGLSEEQYDQLMARSHVLDRRGRARPLFDPRLMKPLEGINFDDVLTPQWPLFDALQCAPLLLLRTQLTDQLRRQTFDEMVRRRPEVTALTISGQGSPALFDQPEEIEAVMSFVAQTLNKPKTKAA
jgi:pimeloyl-ACP methyl ester carboxylesterase